MHGDFGDAVVMNQRKIHVGEFFSGHQARGNFRQRHAGGFADVRNGARGARIDFEDVDRVALDGVLHVHQADDFQRHGKPLRVVANGVENCRRKTDRRKYAGRIAGVHAGFFDVLHDAADDHAVAVGKRVHVDFGRFFQELIDEHGARGSHQRGLRDVLLHGVDVVRDDHGAATEHVAGANEHRQADFARHARGFFRDKRGRVARLRNFQFVEQAAEAAAVFGKVDGFWSGADDRDAVAFQFEREVERSLPAELHDHALRLFLFDDGENVFQA